MNSSNEKDKNFITVECIGCHKTLMEVSGETTGTIKKKCPKCKVFRIISLPLGLKKNNLSSVGAMVSA